MRKGDDMRRMWLGIALGYAMFGCGDANDDGSKAPDRDAAAATSAEACFADLTMPDRGWIEVQRFRADEPGIRVWRARQTTDGPTIGETTAYKLVRVWVQSDEEPGACVHDQNALAYTYQHHNVDETWQAKSASAQYFGHETLDFGAIDGAWNDTLSVKDTGGQEIIKDLKLTEDGCYSLPYDLNPCLRRRRLDEPPPGWGQE
jgi:hypothetical protein